MKGVPLELPETITLTRVGIRVPAHGELYIDRNGKLQRCDEHRTWSKRAKKKLIVKEGWR